MMVAWIGEAKATCEDCCINCLLEAGDPCMHEVRCILPCIVVVLLVQVYSYLIENADHFGLHRGLLLIVGLAVGVITMLPVAVAAVVELCSAETIHQSKLYSYPSYIGSLH